MPVKRSLKLDDQFEKNSFSPSKIVRKKSITAYSPTTGTYQLSPFSSPATPKEQEHRNGPSNETRKRSNLSSPVRQESTVKDSDGFMVLLSKIEISSEKTMEIMKNLSSIQALEGNRQLEDLIGVSLVPCSLKSEARKTKELMTKVIKQKLFEKKKSRITPKGMPAKQQNMMDLILPSGTWSPAQRAGSQSEVCKNSNCITPVLFDHHLDSFEFLKAILN